MTREIFFQKEIEDLKSIEFDNVTFTYPNRSDRIVLENLSLKIQAGKMILSREDF